MIKDLALALSVCGLLLAAACGDDNNAGAPCEDDSNCNLSGGGKCILAPTGNKWCAYPDPDCSGGFRFSDHVGDDLSGVCVEGQKVHLAITIDGDGMVASLPTGISCTGTACSGDFLVGTPIKLVATPASMSFLGWTGACQGISDCMLTLVADTNVGAFFGAPGTALWATQLGGTDFDVVNGIARDGQNNLVVVGRFSTTANFGGTMLTSAGSTDMFVAKLKSSDGSVIWAKRFGGTGADVAVSVAIDGTDAIYLTGTAATGVDFGGGALTNNGNGDIVVVKLDGGGGYVWAKDFGSAGADLASALAVRNGKVAITGYYGDTMTVGTTTLPSGGHGFAFELTAAGAVDWAVPIGNSNVSANAIGIDSAGNSIVAGSFLGATMIGTQTLNGAGDRDIFLAKLKAADGTVLFATGYGGSGADDAAAIAIDPSDGIYLGGSFTSSINFGVGAISGNGVVSYVAKFSIAGACAWSKGFASTGTGNVAPYAVTTALSANGSGDIVIIGGFNGALSLGGAPLNAVPGTQATLDVFAGHLRGQDGSHVSSIRAGGQGYELATSVVQTSDAKYFVAGGFDGFADFGGHALTSAGLKDGFVFAMAPL